MATTRRIAEVNARVWRFKAATLLLAGGLAVHELRYLLAWGGSAQRVEAQQGHGYLTAAAPAVAGLVVLALAAFLLRLLGPRRREGGSAPGFRALWTGCAGLLIALYAVQETVEGALADGHPGGLAALLAHGGWTAVPLAVVVGGVLGLVLREAHHALSSEGPLGAPLRPTLVAPPTWTGLPTPPDPAVSAPLARSLAPRAPPATS